jgi:hypothetical protein
VAARAGIGAGGRVVPVVAAAVAVALVAVAAAVLWPDPSPLGVTVAAVDAGRVRPAVVTPEPPPRTVASYDGLGVWVDAFDYDPVYAGGPPTVTPADVASMAATGARTLYLQTSRQDERATGLVLDPWLVGSFLLHAHRHGMAVVAWYLPKWTDEDLPRLAASSDFTVLGHRVDGLAVDIEWVRDVPVQDRNAWLIELTAALRAHTPETPLGAIVFPPVQTEVINPTLWPDFPWRDLADDYAAWLPMAYWSFRSEESGYRDPYAYVEESVRRLRNNLGDPGARVHPIGGIGAVDGADGVIEHDEPLATVADIDAFVRAVADSGSVGGSLYDWATTVPAGRDRMGELLGRPG